MGCKSRSLVWGGCSSGRIKCCQANDYKSRSHYKFAKNCKHTLKDSANTVSDPNHRSEITRIKYLNTWAWKLQQTFKSDKKQSNLSWETANLYWFCTGAFSWLFTKIDMDLGHKCNPIAAGLWRKVYYYIYNQVAARAAPHMAPSQHFNVLIYLNIK